MKPLRPLLILGFALIAASAVAVQPDEVMKDPALEARARALSAELRCMVCQNQSIDDSDASLAHDIRVLIRQRIAAGESDQAIKTFLVSRYGEFILLKPPLQLNTLLLWGGPPLAFGVGVTFLFFGMRRRKDVSLAPTPLSSAEERRLSSLLDEPPA